MKIFKILQGTPEWHGFRLNHRGASEAAVMLGISPKATRTELLNMKHTGISKEFSDWVQEKVLDHGHEVEAMARPIIEEQIADDLYPVTCSEDDGLLSASCDGMTMDRRLAWEHKQWNSVLATSVKSGVLPEEHQPQCQQIMMVTSVEKVIFTVSDGTKENMVSMEVFPDAEWQKRIRAGWAQFEEDLANFVPVEKTVKPVAKISSNLAVVLDMRVEGKLVACNIERYKPAALAYISNINTKLTTDQHFADADADAKFCRDSADKLELSIEQAMGQMGDINVVINTVREIAAAFDAKGLALEKLVKSEKDARKLSIVSEAAAELVTHIKALNARLGAAIMPTIASDFPMVVKGLKSIDSMRDKVATELARCKIEANATADHIAVNLKVIDQAEYQFLFADKHGLALKDSEFVAMTVKSRIAAHKAAEDARLEAERTRIAEEEHKKAEAASQARADAEIAEAARQAEATRQAEQQAAQLAADAQAVIDKAKMPEIVDPPIVVPVGMSPADELRAVQSMPEGAELSPAAQVLNEAEGAVRFAKAHTPPTLKLGVISTRLGFQVTAEFLRILGFEPAGRERAAVLYHESDFPRICTALILHITEVRQGVAA